VIVIVIIAAALYLRRR